MPIPKLGTNETVQEFTVRCMSDATMLEEYPDSGQRYAVCQAQIENNGDGTSGMFGRAARPLIRNQERDSAEILIYDEIGFDPAIGLLGIGAMEFINEVNLLGNVKELDIRLNSPGGDTFHGFAIYNFLARHPAKINTFVDGMALSIAGAIFMAGDERKMAENAILMMHDPYVVNFMGNSRELRQQADVLDLVGDGIEKAFRDAYTGTSDIATLMTEETWMDAGQAFDVGIATGIDEPMRIAANFKIDKFKHPPLYALQRAKTVDTEEINGLLAKIIG